MMKKILFTISLFASLCANAQILFESFEGNTLPDPITGYWALASGTWLVTDNGTGTAQNWKANESVVVPPNQYHGTRAAYVDRENIGLGNTSEEWLVMPYDVIDSGESLHFFSRTTINGNQGTLYQVRISTVSQTDQSSFVTIEGWSEDDIVDTFNIYKLKTISLAAYEGMTVSIAFVKIYNQPTDSLGGDRWLIDAVQVGGEPYLMNTMQGSLLYSIEPGCAAPMQTSNFANFSPAMFSNAENIYYVPNEFYINSALINSDITITPEAVPYFTPSPATYTFNFSDYENTEVANFCYTPNGTHPDLEITELIELTCSTPGEHTDYVVNFRNKGTEPLTGTVTFNYDEDRMDIIEYPEETEQELTIVYGSGTVSIGFEDLMLFENRTYSFHFTLSTPLDTPPLNAGDQLTFSASVVAGPDETPADNQMNATFTVIGSMDPNEIRVSEGEIVSVSNLAEYLHYQVHFQNIGTGPATNVKIVNTIEEDLDLSTFEILSTSHPVSLGISGRQLQYNFNNILLTAADADFENSVGYISYRIKPAAGAAIGTVFTNDANIYFDYNYPIATNIVTTTVTSLGVHDSTEPEIKMYPNPAKNELFIATDNGAEILNVSIVNILGQRMMSGVPSPEPIDISKLQSGTYFVTVETDLGKSQKKLIKQ